MSASVGLRFAAGMVTAVLGTLVCAQTPAANPDAKLAQLAIEAARAGAITPIPIDESAGPSHGVIYDRFLLGVVAAKAALAAGRTPFAAGPSGVPSFVPMTTVVVAYPRQCENRVSPAQAIRLSTRLTRPSATPGETPTSFMSPARMTVGGPAARALLPGVTLPPSSFVVGFEIVGMFSDASVSIDYSEPLCPATLKTVDLTIHATPARIVKSVMTAALPAEQSSLASPVSVQVHAVIDRDGSVKLPTLVQGPPVLEAAAVEIVKQWRFEPPRANGVPTAGAIQLPITFTATGAAPAAPTIAGAGNLSTSAPSTILSTADLPGINRASSRCAISDDPTYGFALTNPVRVGGDLRTGPSRAARYFSTLRGPNGEGLNVRRTGSTTSEQTVLDIYEITYGGLSTPARLYVDVYHFDELKAPAGFVCGLDFGITAPGTPAGTTTAPPVNTAATPANRTAGLTSSNDEPGLTAATSKCPVADDDTYALSAVNAIRVGGGAEAVSREERYMTALRGPGGIGLKYRRTGAMLAPDQKTIVDVFEVSYAGVVQPIRLYFDRTQTDTLKAPKAWACYREARDARERP